MTKKAVCYYRYSSAGQTEQSIDGQRRVCRDYAKRNGFQIVKEYADRAITGKTDQRPQFLEMIKDAKKRAFEYVIVYKLDRFSRKRYDNVVYKFRLEQSGVKVLSATEAISDTAEGKVMTALLEAMAEMYSEELSQKVKRGMNESVIKGNYFGGHIPFGYKVLNKKFVIEPTEATILRYAFKEYASGKTQKEIVAELNEKGYTLKNNEPFKRNSLTVMFGNKKYIGEYVSRQGTINNDFYPAIIEKELFYKVQDKLKENKQRSGGNKAKEKYILSGKAFCGHCGAPLFGVSGTSRSGERHYYYTCSERWYNKTCKKKYEDKNGLEKFVIKSTLEYVLNPKIIDGIAEELGAVQSGAQTKKDLQEIENRLQAIENELDEQFKRFSEASNAEIRKRIDKECDSLSEEKQLLKKETQRLKLVLKTGKTKEDILAFFKEYIAGKSDDIKFGEKLINNFIDKIFVFDDKIVIYYNVFGKGGITYEKMLADVESTIENTGGQDCSNIKGYPLPKITKVEP